MDAQRFKDAYERLETLDERLTHKLRPRSSLKQPSIEQLSEQMRDAQQYLIEMKDIVRDLFQAIAAKPPAAG
jgi:hypothetical protein